MANIQSDATLFEDQFFVDTIDHKKYDRAARITAETADKSLALTLDINTDLFPCAVGEGLRVMLASTLNLDGTRDDDKGWRDMSKQGVVTLADQFDYVCYGKVYKFEDGNREKTLKAYISFGGLLMSLDGPDPKLTPLRVDYIYLLIRK